MACACDTSLALVFLERPSKNWKCCNPLQTQPTKIIPDYAILCYTLYTVYYILYTIYIYPILYTIHYTLYTIHYTLYTIYYILYTVYYILCTIYSILYTIYYILYIYYIRYTLLYYTIDFLSSTAQLPADGWLSACRSASSNASRRRMRTARSDSAWNLSISKVMEPNLGCC